MDLYDCKDLKNGMENFIKQNLNMMQRFSEVRNSTGRN